VPFPSRPCFTIGLLQQQAVQFVGGNGLVQLPSLWTSYWTDALRALSFFHNDYSNMDSISTALDNQIASDSRTIACLSGMAGMATSDLGSQATQARPKTFRLTLENIVPQTSFSFLQHHYNSIIIADIFKHGANAVVAIPRLFVRKSIPPGPHRSHLLSRHQNLFS
jgi:hypothetical protein